MKPAADPEWLPPEALREIRAGRWQNAAAISGRSVESLRRDHDPAYGAGRSKPEKARHAPVYTPPRERKPFINRPAPAADLAAWKARREAADLTTGDLAAVMKISKGGLQNALSGKGHCSRQMRDRIEAGLAQAEAAYRALMSSGENQ